MKLLHGDCLELMKTLGDDSIDAIITDPPYNISKKNNFGNMINYSGVDFGEWDKDFDLYSYIVEIPRILRRDGSVIIFNDWKNIGNIARYCESLGMVIKDMIRWEKINPYPRNRDRRYVTDFEVAVWCTNKDANWTFNRTDSVYQKPMFKGASTSRPEKTIHPTQKPVWLLEKIIEIHTNKNDIVLDMFAGSGTTGIACINTNRNFIGMELDEQYFKIAKERINNHIKSRPTNEITNKFFDI
jgi:site-specific DNA-methyltransferase (adenine-specific)